MKTRLLTLLALLLAFSFPGYAGSRDSLFHQGLVFDAEDNPVQGTILVTFRLYDTADGTTPLWEELLQTEFKDGLFAVELGQASPFPSGLFSGESLFLGVQIEGDSEMTPRLKLHTVPFAQEAELAVTALSLKDNVITSAQIIPGAIESSDIAVGSIGPAALSPTGVIPGTYALATITVDPDGRILSASPGTPGGNGDITGVITTLGSGLTGGTMSGEASLQVSVDGGSLEIVANTIRVKNVSSNKITGTLEDSQISDTLTIGAGGSVSDSALSSNVSQLGGAIESGEIADGTILNTDINAAAAITWGKISKVGAIPSEVGAAASVHSHLSSEIAGEFTDAQISDLLTASQLVGTGSTTSAVDLQSAEVAGVLGVSQGGTGTDLSATGGANQFVRQSTAGATLTVGLIEDVDVPNNITIDVATTAGALSANGTNCAASEYAQGIDASGNAEGCTSLDSGLLNLPFFDSSNPAATSNTTNDCLNFTNTGTAAGRLGAPRWVTLSGFSTIRLIARAAIATGQGQPTIRIQNVTDGTTLVSLTSNWTTTCDTQTASASITVSGLKKLECQEFSGVATEDPKYAHCAIELIP